MNVRQILDEIDLKYPNDAENETKRGWILTLEKQLRDECLLTHFLTEDEEDKADAIAALERCGDNYEPLAQPPYQDIYVHYVAANIALVNVDTDNYANEQALFNNALLTYKNWFNRNHRTLIGDTRWRF